MDKVPHGQVSVAKMAIEGRVQSAFSQGSQGIFFNHARIR